MRSFFRRIRQGFLESSQARKYILYAIGEIALVVIGILIALSINNWNEWRKDRTLEKDYLQRLERDLLLDKLTYSRLLDERVNKKISVLKKAMLYTKGQLKINDTLSFLNDVGYGGIFSRVNSFKHSPTFDELLNTGNVQLLSNDTLRSAILTYYDNQNTRENYVNSLKSDYATFINGLMPWDSKKPGFVEPTEYQFILSNLLLPKFKILINEELTFAYSMSDSAERLLGEIDNLLLLIKNEISET